MRRISIEVYKKLGNCIPEEHKELHHVAPVLAVDMLLHNGGGCHHHGGQARVAQDPQSNMPPTRQAQAERVKRPLLNLTGQALEQEEYDHFLYMFEQYKNRLG